MMPISQLFTLLGLRMPGSRSIAPDASVETLLPFACRTLHSFGRNVSRAGFVGTFLTVTLLLAPLAFAKAPQKDVAGEVTLATVNGEPLTAKELIDQFSRRHSGHAKFLGGDAEARQFLNALIDQRLFIQEAYDLALDQDPGVAAMVDEFAESKTTELLVRREIAEKAKVTPAEVRDTWEKKLSVLLQIRQIAVDTQAEAEQLRSSLLQGADFEELARTCSRAPSSSRGGHLRLNWGQADEGWETAVFSLEPGALSEPIPTPGGYEIVIVDERIDSALPPFEKFSTSIENVLAQRKLEARKRAFSAELWEKYHVALPSGELMVARAAELLATAPETLIATWDGGGKLTAAQTFNAAELREWAMASPRTAALLIEERLRSTINSPLTALEAKARKLADDPEIARTTAVYRETAMQKVLFAEQIFKGIELTEADARAYYEQHAQEFEEPEQRHVAHILTATEAEAIAVRKTLEAGADFATTAKKSSRDFESALMEGSLGWITAEKVPADFRDVLTLAPGQLSKPIHSKNGWHVVKVLEIKPKRQMAFDEVKEKAQQKAAFEKQQAAQEFWLRKLRASAKVVYDDAAIRKFVAANQFDGNAAPIKHGLQ